MLKFPRKAGRVVRLELLVVLLGCQSPYDLQQQAPPPPTPAPPVQRDAAPVPSFAREIAPVLAKHCTNKDCHGAEQAYDITLDLRPSEAYRQLVGVPAEMGTTHLMRVKPCDPDASMVVKKLTGRLGSKEGKRMPLDDAKGEPVSPSPLPPGFVDDILVRWIRACAPNN